MRTFSFAMGDQMANRTSLLAGACVAALALPQAVAAQAASGQTAAQVSEVVVTAQKRQETVQTVPISVTAFTGDSLERRGVTSVGDLARIAPALTVMSSGPGENNLIIRGISSIAGSAATVGYYLDETPIAASSNAALLSTRGVIDPSVLDIARVEVLRGPQGTLYGSSSMGGTVRYISNQPSLDAFSGNVRGEVSGTEHGGFNWNARGVVNLPLVKDKAALRVAAYYRDDDGYIDRYRIDPTNYLAPDLAQPKDKNVNTFKSYGFRAALLVQPDSTLSITPSFLYQYSKLGTPFTYDKNPASRADFYQVRDIDEPNIQKSWIANLTVKKDAGPVELVSSSSYYHRSVSLVDDSSKVINFFFGLPTVYPVAMSGSYLNKEFTQEVRASTKLEGPFQAIVGAFYHDVKAPLHSEIPFPAGFNDAFGTPFPGFSTIYAGVRRARLQEYAVFGEVSYAITPTVTARAGVRRFRVDQGFYQSGDGVFNGGFSEVTNSSRDKGTTPKATLEWRPSSNQMIYLTASKGYRPGGPNNPAPASLCGAEVQSLGLGADQLTRYGPDHLWNYELGAKTSWLDKRLTINGSIYDIEWSKVQQQIVLACGFNLTANFGKAYSRGGELEMVFRPDRHFTFNAAAGYTNARLKNDVPGTDAKDGDALQNVPHWNATAGVEYQTQFGADYSGYGRVDYSYVGPSNFLFDRTSPFYRRKGFAVVNTRVGLQKDGQAWELSLFVNNLFDIQGETDLPVAISADLPTTRRVGLNQPRTVGMAVEYKY
ncbi:TonB-dependent receptor [Phenylobacterium sp. LjRoot225]|uniref:TonB-dependent receptor n=1 Tax=Phenylobacterium sp. LjRoot225 TaxID=3342285 RepID=UPI003ECD45AE